MMSWEEMSPLEQAQCMYWDMYKDAYGSRPRGIDTTNWTLEEFEAEFQMLGKVIEQEEIARKESEVKASARLEEQILSLMVTNCKLDRAGAIRWIHEAEGSNGDDEYLCFLLGLPYGYFREAA